MSVKVAIIGLINILFLSTSLKAQTPEESKYLVVITYLQNNEEFLEKVNLFYPGVQIKKEEGVCFNVSEEVIFLGLAEFRKAPWEKDYWDDTASLKSEAVFGGKYYFNPFKSDLLSKIPKVDKTKMLLTFSKPFEDYLIIEFGEYDPVLMNPRKFGKWMRLFFEFDSLGLIEDVIYAGATYN